MATTVPQEILLLINTTTTTNTYGSHNGGMVFVYATQFVL
jgi:hypothetical protein